MNSPLKNKGSVLVFSLIVLSIVLSAALSIAAVTVSNRKSAASTSQSVQSFQVADSGAERVLKEIYKNSHVSLEAMRTAVNSSGAVCASGSFSFPVSGGTSLVTFFDSNNVVISCGDTTWRNTVAKIKVEGTASGTTRVIETAVAASQDYKVCYGEYASPSFGSPVNSHAFETVVPSSWSDETCRDHVMDMKGGASEVKYQLKCFFTGGTTSEGNKSGVNPGSAAGNIPTPTNCGW